MRATRIVVVCVVVVACAAGGAWWWSTRDAVNAGSSDGVAARAEASSSSKSSAPSPGAPATTAQAAPAVARPRPVQETPLPEGPIGDTYAELVSRAEAGDGRAAMALARALALCADYVEDEREVLEEDMVEFLANAEDTKDATGASSRDRFVDMAVRVLDMRASTCGGIGALPITDRAAERERWLALGLESGHPEALVQEADAMIRKRFPRRTDIIDNAEELRLLRPQAMAMLQRAAAQGEPMGLLRMAGAHRTGDLAQRDPVAAYAYLLAYRAGPSAHGVPGFLLGNAEQQFTLRMTPEQIEAARAHAERIRAACCGEG